MFDSLPQLPHQQRWRQQAHPQPIVVAIIERRPLQQTAHYLLICRNSEPYFGQWALVGGKWDFGETLASAVTREVQEETGLESRFVALRGMVNERMSPTDDNGQAGHFLLFVCQVEAAGSQAEEQAEGAPGWFTWPELDALHQEKLIIPSDYAMLRRFARSGVALPHYEAEMITRMDPAGNTAATLLRFEER